MMSDNLYNFIKNRLQTKAKNSLLIIGKEKDLDASVDLFIDYVNVTRNSTLVYYAAEIHKKDICLKHKGFQLLNKKVIRWSFRDEILEVFGKSSLYEEIDSLYEGDKSRITRMRLNRLLGRRSANFLFQKVKVSFCDYKLIIFCWPLLLWGLLLKLSRVSPKYDEISEFKDINNNRIIVFRSQMYEKDHYGEAPLDIKKRKQIVEECMNIFSDYTEICVLIFIGQRVRWYQEIEDSVKKLSFSKATFFVFSAWRNSHKKELKHVSGGEFCAGSNTDLNNNTIFSPHCISIGALDHELWYKEISSSHK